MYGSLLFLLFLSPFFLNRNLGANALRDIQSSLVSQARLIENQIDPEKLQQRDTLYLEALTVALSQKIDCRITIIDTQGKVRGVPQISRRDLAHGKPPLSSGGPEGPGRRDGY
jgi:hypothetical protein